MVGTGPAGALAVMNWRGFVAPAGVSAEEKAVLIDIVTQMLETQEWQGAIDRNRWKESFATGDEFGQFLVDEQQRVDAILEDLGLV